MGVINKKRDFFTSLTRKDFIFVLHLQFHKQNSSKTWKTLSSAQHCITPMALHVYRIKIAFMHSPKFGQNHTTSSFNHRRLKWSSSLLTLASPSSRSSPPHGLSSLPPSLPSSATSAALSRRSPPNPTIPRPPPSI